MVVIFEHESCEYHLPDTPTEFIKWFEDKFDLCPQEYKEKLKIDCSTSECYGSSQLEICIYYYRPETDEEYENRLKAEQSSRECKENRELCELERLKQKYGV